jgi:catechol 2,3-dioxygenase-like lactoylglutathione lyase family enzyme
MIRVKDPKVSLHFYQEVLGMDLIYSKWTSSKRIIIRHHALLRSVALPMTFGVAMPNDAAGFTLYFVAYAQSDGESSAEITQKNWTNREGMSRTFCLHNEIILTYCDRCFGTDA